jgi:hypothetical protein
LMFPASSSGYGLGLVFVDDTTALVVAGQGVTAASVDAAAADNGQLAASPTFAELFADIDSDDPLWFVLGPTSPMFADINASLAPYTSIRVAAVYGSVDVTSSLSAQVGVRLASPDQVAQLVGDIRNQVQQVIGGSDTAAYFDQFDVDADDNDVIVSLAADAAQLVNLASAMRVAATASVTPATPDGPGTFTLSAGVGTN